MKAPISSSKSNLLHSVKLGTSEVGGFVYPLGLTISVPLITTVELLPWYPIIIKNKINIIKYENR